MSRMDSIGLLHLSRLGSYKATVLIFFFFFTYITVGFLLIQLSFFVTILTCGSGSCDIYPIGSQAWT